ncbi:S-adenosyl-L-methionine-dependent methyltransferase [Xylogone sp. PMI_703]|nr:S-adenosyl-L-methionine-dependent methyltransferase [Xylogone sp. PMI_703]
MEPSSSSPAATAATAPGGGVPVATPAEPGHDFVEIDDEHDFDGDSALGSEVASSFTASLNSSVLNYVYENGRRYHAYKSGEYPFPNDEKEQEREDLKHHVFQLVLNGELHLAPLGTPQRILDIGTGTGIWAIDVADLYPSAEVTGIDLSPIQPRWVPPNCSFVVDNVEDDWLYTESQAFDYIHLRAMSGSIKDWPRLYEQVFEHTKSGGWVEAQDHDVQVSCDDDTINKATEWVNWMRMVNEAAGQFGKILDVGPRQKQWMIDAGFVDVHEKVYKLDYMFPLSPLQSILPSTLLNPTHNYMIKVPIGRWPKDKRLKNQGVYLQALNVEALEPISMVYFTKVLNMSVEAVHAALVGPRKDIMNPALHLYVKFRFVYGRKP